MKKRPLTNKELSASGGVYTGLDRVWLVPQAVLPPGLVPKPADVLTDQRGVPWTVLEATANKNGATWNLKCRDLVLAFDLRDLVNIERATITYDAAGVPVKAFPTSVDGGPIGGSYIAKGLPARVQLLTDEIIDERGIRGFKGTHAIIVSDQLTVTNEDRVSWTQEAKTTYFEIVGIHNPQRIDELPVLDCELRP